METPEAIGETDQRRRWLALAVLCAASGMVVLDGTIVTVALPSIQRDLGFSRPGLAWVVNAYLIAFAGLLLLSGRLGDLLGARRVFLGGLTLFTLASLACGLAQDQAMLAGFRFVQGAGGALSSAVLLGMIAGLFQEPRERATAIGVYSFVQAAGGSAGLIVGGLITQALSWHWTFAINVPIGLVTGLLARRVLARDSGPGWRAGADVTGAVLVTGGLMLLVSAIVLSGSRGWGDAATLGALATGLLLIAGFLARQAIAAHPLLPLRLFRSRTTSGANLVMVLMVAGLFGFQFVTALYLQQVLGYDVLTTGLAFLPAPVAIAVVSLGLAARLEARFGARGVLVTGLTMVAAGLVLLARVPADGRYLVDVAPALTILGLGFGAAMPALMGQAMTGVSPADAGVASGLINTSQQAGGALGTAALVTLAAGRTAGLIAGGADRKLALASGFHLAYAASAGFVLLALLTAVLVLRPARSHDHDREDPPAVIMQSCGPVRRCGG